MDQAVVLKTFLRRHEAGIAKGLLDESGISSMILSDDCGGWQTWMSFGFSIKLMVNDQDLQRAKEIIQVLND